MLLILQLTKGRKLISAAKWATSVAWTSFALNHTRKKSKKRSAMSGVKNSLHILEVTSKSKNLNDKRLMGIANSFAGQVVRKFATSGHPLHRKSANNTTNGFIYLRLLCDVARNFLPPGGNRRQLRKIRCVGIEFFGESGLDPALPKSKSLQSLHWKGCRLRPVATRSEKKHKLFICKSKLQLHFAVIECPTPTAVNVLGVFHWDKLLAGRKYTG